ncbi:Hypothetical protein PHPALM_5685 [Phytophthora palmivora]|uniref:Reverse transcriptase n=1 Tax=Phytophthora palmivora TaxID=4796 RepID=A0A2P4YGS5_9STRA|nr:Hypothetical protein PHPALM_5685 [Phytophthora palmivora]
MVGESKSPHSTPTFCIWKPNVKWRLDVLLINKSGCTLYSAVDLVDGYYQILMRMLELPQGMSNAPATFNRLVTQLFRPLRTFAQTRAENGQTAMEVHLKHLRRMFEVMRANKLYANIDKCLLLASISRDQHKNCIVYALKVKAIAAWLTPRTQKDLRKGLGLANYLHKYSVGYAELARPLSDLLNKDADWVWEQQHQDAFDSIKAS